MEKLIFFLVLTTMTLSAPVAGAEKLVLKGSDALGSKLVPRLADAYKTKHPEVVFEITTEDSGSGINGVIQGSTDIGMASRRANVAEMTSAADKGVKLFPTLIAFDGASVIVNNANPVHSLTKKQIEQIFSGDVADWSAVGGTPGKISVYDTEFMQMNKSGQSSSVATGKLAGNGQAAAEVGKDAHGIACVSMAFLDVPGIKPVSNGGVLPTKAGIQSHLYPLTHPAFFYTKNAPLGLAADFIRFVLSPEGARIVDDAGLVPVK